MYLNLIYVIIFGVVIFMNINYDDRLNDIIKEHTSKGEDPRVLLHSCCGPCSSYVIEYLSKYFYLTIIYYNPNISPREEYEKRKMEQIRVINELETMYSVDIIDCDYDNDLYERNIVGLENEPERGRRCDVCFRMRLYKTGVVAKENNYDYFCTTLTVSPYKNSNVINEIGFDVGHELGISYLASDFKKRDGYKRSIELSREFGLYRQDYCGCKYSKEVYERKLKEKELLTLVN